MTAQETAIKSKAFGFKRLVEGTKRFLREVRAELKKVSWPDKKELSAYTGVVFISVIIAAIIIWAMDSVLTEALRILIK